ncbi:hypothetical protein I3843_14G002700 [Carya illinoinensis]|uniref:Stress-response A/B barrel domain-containing protein n=1 Tax=Carya illinoinensis TaxID=32201 RepID=A0A8T1NEE2_CARIL|nr:stress-response A/B barrel domain-containing protein HS1-like [Carya illinoinensis]KAG6628232.1 hypothetical protein CIPAW_14G000900 [Carya illinoinensis]KAG6676933.1 hypothetical protein I3842_14G003000 [Carya illinoinensis]KAG7945693.1 hypothetical protein I3843_14G002700 [Carya illinoinensis]
MEAEEGKGSVLMKHVVIAKFKDGTSAAQIEQLIKDMANQVNLIDPLKSLHWGKDVSPWNKNEGYTHVFECNFESMEGIAEYAAHPAHLEYAKSLLPYVEKYILFDYKLNTQAAAII